MDFLRRCRSCRAEWQEPKVYCPHCGDLSDQIPVPKRVPKEIRQARREALAKARTIEEVEELARKFGYRKGFARVYWDARQRVRG